MRERERDIYIYIYIYIYIHIYIEGHKRWVRRSGLSSRS